MKIAILGYATEGRVSYDYYKKQGHEVHIHDSNSELHTPEGVPAVLGDAWLDNLDQYDLLVRTAGLNPDKIATKNPGVASKTTTAINEFFEVCPTKNLIGVTGTKGKGTTSTLIFKFLEQAGYKVWLAGNIGRSPLEFVHEINPEDYVVLELSSFQLIDIRHSPHTAICLLVEPEHFDWHADLDEYIGAKQQLFRHQVPDDIAVFYNESYLSNRVASVSAAKKSPYFDRALAHFTEDNLMIGDDVICKLEDILLPGRHNLQNICAAITATHDKIDSIDVYADVVTTIEALPYRIQPIVTKNGTNYYNDSFSSTPTATMACIDAINGPKILIVGGKDKNSPVDELTKCIASKKAELKHVILIGQLSDKIAEGLDSYDFKNYSNLGMNTNMASIVQLARSHATEGDSVILSPGSSSFDMFKNFQDRGDQFNEAVKAL